MKSSSTNLKYSQLLERHLGYEQVIEIKYGPYYDPYNKENLALKLSRYKTDFSMVSL